MGTLVSALGCYCSVFFDTPTGATIVCTFGAVLVVMAAVKAVFFRIRQEEPQQIEVVVR
jgi:ABC-type Mn2+/Zn2+ transport system permease subunit